MRPIPFQTLSPFGNSRLVRPAAARPASWPGGAAFGSAAGQGFLFGTPTVGRER